jgi:hypothetical protein
MSNSKFIEGVNAGSSLQASILVNSVLICSELDSAESWLIGEKLFEHVDRLNLNFDETDDIVTKPRTMTQTQPPVTKSKNSCACSIQ